MSFCTNVRGHESEQDSYGTLPNFLRLPMKYTYKRRETRHYHHDGHVGASFISSAETFTLRKKVRLATCGTELVRWLLSTVLSLYCDCDIVTLSRPPDVKQRHPHFTMTESLGRG